MTREQVINDLVELGKGLTKKEFQELTDGIIEVSLKRILEDNDLKDVTVIKPVIDKIFELCPSCTFVPLAYAYNDYIDVETSKEWDGLVDVSETYIGDIIPKKDDNMTLGNAKELYRLWEEASKLSNIQEGREKNVADYTENTYFDIIGYDKNTGGIITMYKVNR